MRGCGVLFFFSKMANSFALSQCDFFFFFFLLDVLGKKKAEDAEFPLVVLLWTSQSCFFVLFYFVFQYKRNRKMRQNLQNFQITSRYYLEVSRFLKNIMTWEFKRTQYPAALVFYELSKQNRKMCFFFIVFLTPSVAGSPSY